MPTDGFQLLPCVFGINVVDLSLQLEDLFRLDGDISGLALDTRQNSVNRPHLDFRPCLKISELVEPLTLAPPEGW